MPTSANDGAAYTIRRAQRADSDRLLCMMRELAAFEFYLDQFAVDAAALQAAAFSSSPICQIWVAEGDGELQAYAVTYLIPYTYDLRPTLVLKELYVCRAQRGSGIGSGLLRAVATFALTQHAARLKWDVLAGNDEAEAFYRRHGGRRDAKWLSYQMDEIALMDLTAQNVLKTQIGLR